MSGFGEKKKVNLEVQINQEEVNKLIKDYKKIKKYMRSSLYTVKTMDGTEDVVSELLKEYQENPMD